MLCVKAKAVTWPLSTQFLEVCVCTHDHFLLFWWHCMLKLVVHDIGCI